MGEEFTMEDKTEKRLGKVLQYLEEGNPLEAKRELGEIMPYDLESRELLFTSSCCNFWADFLFYKLSPSIEPFERAEKLLEEWKIYRASLAEHEVIYEPTLRAICRGVFSLARGSYLQTPLDKNPVYASEIKSKAGFCFKKLGEFDVAKEFLTTANRLNPHQPSILAELADCYALCGQEKEAKVLFREAFYIDSKRIDIDLLEAPMIRSLIEKIQIEKKFSGDTLKAWIPVYGVLWGIFTVKRSLTFQEVSRLRQEIYALENEYKDPSRKEELMAPRLINLYFWFIDWCLEVGESAPLNEILLKIKILDMEVYNLYCK